MLFETRRKAAVYEAIELGISRAISKTHELDMKADQVGGVCNP